MCILYYGDPKWGGWGGEGPYFADYKYKMDGSAITAYRGMREGRHCDAHGNGKRSARLGKWRFLDTAKIILHQYQGGSAIAKKSNKGEFNLSIAPPRPTTHPPPGGIGSGKCARAT